MCQHYIWTHDSARKLIDLYRERRLLWDTTMPDYKDRIKKNAAWTQIAKYFELDRGIVEKKMKMMVGQYRREVARHGEGVESRWYAYSWLQFLPSMANSHTYTQDTSCEGLPSPGADDEEESAEAAEDPTRSTEKTWRQLLSTKKCDSASKPDSVKDDSAVYGEYIASKMRNLRSQHARNTVQYLINKIMYSAEMGQFDHVDGRRVRIITEQHYFKEPSRSRGPPPRQDDTDDSGSDSDSTKIKIVKVDCAPTT